MRVLRRRSKVGGLVEGFDTLEGGCGEQGENHGKRRELGKKMKHEDEIVDGNYQEENICLFGICEAESGRSVRESRR